MPKMKYTAFLRDTNEDTTPGLELDSETGSSSGANPTLRALRRSALARSDNELNMECTDNRGALRRCVNP